MQALEVLGRTPLVHELCAPPFDARAAMFRGVALALARAPPPLAAPQPATPLPPVRAHSGVRGYGCAMAVCDMYPLLSTTFGLAGDPVY